MNDLTIKETTVSEPAAAEIPSRYRYESNLNQPSFKLLANVGRVLFGVKQAELPPATAAGHAQGLMQVDALADQVVADLYCEGGGGAALFNRVLAEGLDIDADIPESLKSFYQQVTTAPPWLEPERLENAIVTSHRVGRIGLYGLAMLGLLAGYSNPDLAKPLVATGALTGDSTFRRVNYTSAFWMEVTKDADALKPGHAGFNTAIHVRIKHALARRHILKKTEWKTEQWGLPINRSDSAITNVGFSTMFVLSSKLLGFRITNQEFDDVLHLWRYLGYLLGDDDRLLPKNAEEAVQALGFVAAGNDNIPDKDSIQLANDLLESFKQKGRGPWLEFSGFFKNLFYRAYAQYLIPRSQHRALQLPGSYGLFLLVALQTPLILVIDNFRHYTRVLTPLFKKLGRRGQNVFIRNRFAIADSKYQSNSSNESMQN